ncbi:hypothetical protein KEM54_005521 [Ascosphaera aggregata]|nr:hypothetical protein KEM54_005521 [Ascosphaera aggregata]
MRATTVAVALASGASAAVIGTDPAPSSTHQVTPVGTAGASAVWETVTSTNYVTWCPEATTLTNGPETITVTESLSPDQSTPPSLFPALALDGK